MLAALDVGMRKLIHNNHRRLPLQDGVDVHLLEDGTFVLQLAARNSLQFRGEFGRGFAAMSFNHADEHVLAATGPPNRFAQHRISFADSWRVAEKELEYALGFRRRNFL